MPDDDPQVESVPLFDVEPFDPDNLQHLALVAEHLAEASDGE